MLILQQKHFLYPTTKGKYYLRGFGGGWSVYGHEGKFLLLGHFFSAIHTTYIIKGMTSRRHLWLRATKNLGMTPRRLA